MKRSFYYLVCCVAICLLSYSTSFAQVSEDFEGGCTYSTFGGVTSGAIIVDPIGGNGTNVLELCKPVGSEVWGGGFPDNPACAQSVDLSTSTQVCLDVYSPIATTILVKLEQCVSGCPNWEQTVAVAVGWTNVCVDVTLPDAAGSGMSAFGDMFGAVVLFPDFGNTGTDDCYYFDNISTPASACDLVVVPGTATCDALTDNTDTYSATFTFNQPAAPGAGTYTLSTTSGGTIGGMDPNIMTSGTITISGISEGTDADLIIQDGANCDLNILVTSPVCVPSYNVTFEVNMCEAIQDGSFDPLTQAIFVTGGNANQTGFYGDCGLAMTDPDGDGIYTISQAYPDGYVIGYKFYVGLPTDASTGNCTGGGYEPNLPMPCGFGNYGDREFAVSGSDVTIPVVCYGSCTDCTACTGCELVLTAGTATCDANTAGTDTYTATFTFSQITAPGAGTYTSTTSSGGTIGGDNPDMMTTGIITISGIAEGTDADITIQDGVVCDLSSLVTTPSCDPLYNITFEVNMCEEIANGTFDPAVDAVYVTGGNANQTGWYADCGLAMTDPDGDGIYTITQAYPDGYAIGYKFYVGLPSDAGTANCDGAQPVLGYEPDLMPCGVGAFFDREFIVSGADATVPVSCFGSCTDCTGCTNCDLVITPISSFCDSTTSGTDTYTVVYSFAQSMAPGAGTFTFSTTSGGTILLVDDPNLVTGGAINLIGVPEGVDGDLIVTDGASCTINLLEPALTCLPSFNVTFEVNMCEAILNGDFDPAADEVFVTGGNANQTGNYSDCGVPMVDPDGDGIYTLTQGYPDGYVISYKFYIGLPGDSGTANCTGTMPVLGFEQPLMPCGVGAYGDREYTVAGADATLPVNCFNSCSDCTGCSIDGCTDPVACNYDASATNDDGSCLFNDCLGICGGSDIVGSACDDGDPSTLNDVYQIDCSCSGTATPGCIDPVACNYDANATSDDGSCIFATGCDACDGMGGVTDNPEPGDSCDDGDPTTTNDIILIDCSCTGGTIPGCIDPAACNFDASATVDNGSCVFATGCDICDGMGGVTDNPEAGDSCDDGDATTLNDVVQADCSCSGLVAPGCIDPAACNFDVAATVDDGSCIFATGCDICDGMGGVIDNLEAGDTCDDGDPTTANDVIQADCTCSGAAIPGCIDANACTYDANATVDDGSCQYNDCLGVCGGATVPGTTCDDGDPTTTGDVYDINCNCTGNTTPGCTDACAPNYDPSATADDGSCMPYSTTCNNDCLLGNIQTWDASTCSCVTVVVPVLGCTDPAATNYDPAVTCPDGSCIYVTSGCTDPCASNFDSSATTDDGSCMPYDSSCNQDCTLGDFGGTWDPIICDCTQEIISVSGCTDATATNYNPMATCEDGTCIFVNGGCTDPCASNYDATATSDDGSCLPYDTTCNTDCTQGDITVWDASTCACVVQTTTVAGCTNPSATNYDPAANCDDGSCTIPNAGCTDPCAPNYDPTAINDDGSCTTYDTSCNTDCTQGDITTWDAATCSCAVQTVSVNGCTDPLATNYDPAANCENNTCTYPATGCTDPCAPNYDPVAVNDDGSCLAYDTSCNADCTQGDITAWDVSSCSCIVQTVSVNGCTDPLATNYDPAANCDDGTCVSACSTDAGIMPTGIQIACWGQTISVSSAGANAGGQAFVYFLHDGSFSTVYATSTTGLFANDGSSAATNVFPEPVISAVAGPAGANGLPDLNDPCTTVSNGTPIRFLSEILINAEYICNDNTGEYNVTFDVSGGYPDYPNGNNAFYTMSGDYSGVVNAGQSVSFGPQADGSTTVLNVTDDQKGCSTSISHTETCIKLPVSLLEFTGEALPSGNLIKWSTATETENDFFTLEYSKDGTSFENLSQIDGSGTSTAPNAYTYIDKVYTSGTTYYRLSQTDFDGTTVSLGIIVLSRDVQDLSIVGLSPVPAYDFINISFIMAESSEVIINVADANGKTVLSERTEYKSGINELNLETSSYSPGIYFISLTSSYGSTTKKFFKE